jgi:hypothetical protein
MLIEEYFAYRDNYPTELISKILDRLNSILITQIDELHTQNEKINYWQHPIEALGFKLSSHVASLQNLLSKSSFPYKGKYLKILDTSSINIITRAIIENYLSLYHFHFDPVSNEQKEFRFLVYVVSALRNRQSFSTTSPENAAQKAKDLIEIENFHEHLKNNNYFLNLSERQQAHYLKTKEAKELNWTTLLDSSDLKPELFKDIWRLHSNYAHSEFLSILQIRDPSNLNNLNSNAWLTSELTSIVLASTIYHLGVLFKSAQAVIDTFDDDTKLIHKYFFSVGNKGYA